ncbi:AAA family ATPase [Mesorhizobium sp. YM1C-6-2]|uniref:ATP-dependent nuclease n=1 Tax=Mesorhizobium sp. YM1C-6-2 TaxID=1827501 RepID=UPI000EF1793F|nr:AAA family ATPase [Mesorhizobium sp. YM1C-6-2]RLP23994.1 DUF2813 domain-containing protein [Mesorhizobium sp. YM1C-6-2]
MRVRRITIRNFRGVSEGVVDLPGHTLIVGDNNVGKSTLCEALDLALGTERLFKRPIVDEHDFHNGDYLRADKKPVVIQIEVVLLGLSEEHQRTLLSKTRPWSESKGGFVDVEGATPADLDGADVVRALPIVFMGWYDRKLDDFEGKTYFSHPASAKHEEDVQHPGDGLEPFGREWKQKCGFIYLRTLRTGRRALSLERGSLLDTILRLGDTGRESMWEDTILRLREFSKPIGSIAQLKKIREQVQERMQRFIGIAETDDATAFFASDLTRENLREVVQFFIRSKGSDYAVPFHRLGTGSINTLVFALLTHIADLRGNGSVIFAMEEPEIALPPHTQRRVTRYLRSRMGQAIVTSHSPNVINEFDVGEILAIGRSETHVLSATPLPKEGVRYKTIRRHKLQLSDVVLSRGVIAAEGETEVAALMVTSEALETLAGPGSYDPLDLTGITLFDAGGQGDVPKWGPVFSSLNKRAFAFQDKPKTKWTEEQKEKLGLFEVNVETSYTGIEALLAEEVAVPAQRRFLREVSTWPEYRSAPGTIAATTPDADVRAKTKAVLIDHKGGVFARHLIEKCQAKDELPKTIVDFLIDVYQRTKLPPLGDDAPEDRGSKDADKEETDDPQPLTGTG